MKVWPTGVGKSLAVGVGTRGEGGEIDLDLVDEGMLQLHVWGLEYAGLTEAMQGLSGHGYVSATAHERLTGLKEMKRLDSNGRIRYTGERRKGSCWPDVL